MKVTTAIVQKEIKPREDGRFPVKLRVTYRRMQKFYTMRNDKQESIYLNPEEFLKIKENKARGDLKDLTIYLNEQESIARTKAQSLAVFTFEAFERKLFGAGLDEQDLPYSFRLKDI